MKGLGARTCELLFSFLAVTNNKKREGASSLVVSIDSRKDSTHEKISQSVALEKEAKLGFLSIPSRAHL
jgi:hypothetical protein